MLRKLVFNLIILAAFIITIALAVAACDNNGGSYAEPNWGDWRVTAYPTCTEYGKETKACQNDSSITQTRTIAPLSHTLINKVSNNILIIQNNDEAYSLYNILSSEFNVSLKNIAIAPATVTGLRAWDKIILANISNDDMSNDFSGALYSFVHDYGGSVMTIGNGFYDGTINSAFERMLPFTPTSFIPPVAVMFMINNSNSLFFPSDNPAHTRMRVLIRSVQNTVASMQTQSPQDYVGAMSFNANPRLVAPISSVSNAANINGAIGGITHAYGANFFSALRMATDEMINFNANINANARRHIVFITNTDRISHSELLWEQEVRRAYDNGITVSFIGMVSDFLRADCPRASRMAALGGGRYIMVHYIDRNLEAVVRTEAMSSELRGLDRPFRPRLAAEGAGEMEFNYLGEVFSGVARQQATVILIGVYDMPVWLYWDFGRGKVSSFLSSLHGQRAEELLDCVYTGAFFADVIRGLMPQYSLRRVCSVCGVFVL